MHCHLAARRRHLLAQLLALAEHLADRLRSPPHAESLTELRHARAKQPAAIRAVDRRVQPAELELVTERTRLLVRVGRAADMAQQCGVASRPRLLGIDAELSGDLDRDRAAAQRRSHRVPVRQVRRQRERTENLEQPVIRHTRAHRRDLVHELVPNEQPGLQRNSSSRHAPAAKHGQAPPDASDLVWPTMRSSSQNMASGSTAIPTRHRAKCSPSPRPVRRRETTMSSVVGVTCFMRCER